MHAAVGVAGRPERPKKRETGEWYVEIGTRDAAIWQHAEIEQRHRTVRAVNGLTLSPVVGETAGRAQGNVGQQGGRRIEIAAEPIGNRDLELGALELDRNEVSVKAGGEQLVGRGEVGRADEDGQRRLTEVPDAPVLGSAARRGRGWRPKREPLLVQPIDHGYGVGDAGSSSNCRAGVPVRPGSRWRWRS